MASAVIIGFLLLGKAAAVSWTTVIVPDITVNMNSIVTVPFTISYDASLTKLSFIPISNTDVAEVKLHSLTPNETFLDTFNGVFNITGVFLGRTKLTLSLIENGVIQDSQDISTITVVREERMIDHIFTGSVAILVSLLYINFGCAMDWNVCRNTLSRPIGPTIGFFCQFLFMPLLSFLLGYVLFPDRPELQIGMFFTGVSPSGGASNIWTVLLDGNLNLSVTMTTACTIAALGMMPLWIFTLGRYIFDKGDLAVPYRQIGLFLIALVIPLAIGFAIQKKFPRISKILVRIIKPCSAILIIFIIVFAIVTNLYLFKLFTWKIILAGMGLPWLGFIFGFIIAKIFKQPQADIRAIAIETGIQNTGVSIFLLRFTLKPPAADLTTVVPVSSAIMTPIPLTILYIIKLIYQHRRKPTLNNVPSLEKLQQTTDISTVSQLNASDVSVRPY